MPARILDGNEIAAKIKTEVAEELGKLLAEGVEPGLAVVLVGNRAPSQIYVRNKVKACEALGVRSEKYTPAETASTQELIDLIHGLNRRDEIDGILVQLPLPKQVDAKAGSHGHRPRQGRRRLPSPKCGSAGPAAHRTGALHAGWDNGDFEAQ